jgi:MATE family multidrug resistance protein
MSLGRRWRGVNGYRHLLSLGLPIVAANISVSAMLFTSRLFLSHHSLEALAASLPAGVTYLTVAAFFQGLVSYVSVFTAQYTGAGRPHRAAAALTQGLYLSIISGLLVGLTYFAAPFLFRLGGHPPHIQELEVLYYRILCVPAALNMIFLTLSSFLSGLGRTRMVMWVNLAGALVNIPLTYILVFGFSLGGRQIIASHGLAGAAAADVITWLLITIIFALIVFNRKMEASHGVRSAWKPDFKLMKRLIFYGFPGGFQRFLELGAFTFFAFAVGQLGEIFLAANNIIFSLESLSFFPMLGVGIGVSILVGQSIGRGRPDEAGEAMISGVGISTFYVLLVAAVFLLAPKPLLGIFLPADQDPETSRQIIDLGVILLRFVVAYILFDGLFMCSFGALSGAGDVWFPMAVMGLGGIFTLIAPILLLFKLDLASINTLWLVFVFYILIMNAAVTWRFRQGRWRNRRVIEKT